MDSNVNSDSRLTYSFYSEMLIYILSSLFYACAWFISLLVRLREAARLYFLIIVLPILYCHV